MDLLRINAVELPNIEMPLDIFQEWENMFDEQEEEYRRRRFRRIVVDRMDPFQAMSEKEFIERFRLRKRTIHILIQNVEHNLPVTHDRRGSPVPPNLQVLIALGCIATGTHQNVLGDCYNVSQPTVSRCLKRVARAIAGLRPRYVKFPQDIQTTMEQFYNIRNMPGVIGCIDFTQVAIKKPPGNNSEVFRCRKGYYSLNVQAICGPDQTFYDVVARWSGSTHDGRVLRNSAICQSLEEGAYPGHLLGDSGYGCTTYLLTPVPNPRDVHEARYNASHIRTRNTVERAFGVIKRRFGYLGKRMNTNVNNTKVIIVAAFVLHNLAIMTRVPEPENVEVVNDEIPAYEDAPAYDGPRNMQGQAKRREIIRNYF